LKSSRGLLLLAAAVAVLWFTALAVRPLFNPDEGRYAEIPREMLAGGDWVVPHLNGLTYIEKPPLQYWATAVVQAVLGPSAFAARLYSSLCALAAVAFIAWAARRLWTREAAVRAAAVAASMLLFVLLGQLLTLDMSLTFYMTVCLCAFLVAQAHAEQQLEQAARTAMLLAWAAAALGMMTKGLVAAVIPAAVLVVYSAVTRDLSPWRRLHIPLGLPLFLLIAAPWHVLAQRRLPDFFEFFFVREHFARFMTPVADRQEPFWFFAVVFLLGTLPWTWSALQCVFLDFRRAPARRFDAPTFVRIWVLFILVFFSLSDSKLVPYVLPALPALALLIAAQPLARLLRDVASVAVLMTGLGVVLGAGAAVLPWLLRSAQRAPYFLGLRPGLALAAVILMLVGASVWRRRARDVTLNGALLASGWLGAVLSLLCFAGALAPVYSGATLAAALPAVERAAAPVYSVRTYDQTLPYYWQRAVTLVEYRGELDYGLRHAPRSGIASLADFQVRWLQHGQAYAIMEPETLEYFHAGGLPMRELARDVHRVVVARQ
jgi:4-amino-4-deoxy-L-arabinose transferase-like glycosyltransferase